MREHRANLLGALLRGTREPRAQLLVGRRRVLAHLLRALGLALLPRVVERRDVLDALRIHGVGMRPALSVLHSASATRARSSART